MRKIQRPGFKFVLALILFSAIHANAQMPREDVINVPAVGEGLWVSNLFQSGMVLQRDKPIHLWGWADPGEKVTVSFGGSTATAVTQGDRRWSVLLGAQKANRKPQQVKIQGANEKTVLENVLVGDVWILGGQSNMEFELAKVENGDLEIISANYPEIRILTIPYGEGPDLKQGFARLHEWSGWFGKHFRKGDWDVCTPEKARELSAIGFVFARRIHMASGIPIGVIDASRGGTTVETWTPLEELRKLDSPPTLAKIEKFEKGAAEWDAQADLEKRIEQHRKWIARQESENKTIPQNRMEAPNDLRPGPIADHNFPGHCYAGMIAPIRGLSVKGVIFHQGYNNAFDGTLGVELYRDVLPAMIRTWRAAFGDEQLPFGILSLCTDGYPQTRDDYCEKMFNTGIEIRAAQYLTFLKLFQSGDKNIGFASSYDLRRRWYHPQLKIPAGERLARWALATQYGFDNKVRWKPPMLVGQKRVDGALELTFDMEVGDPQDGAIEGFAIAGKDRRFHPADVAYAEKGKDNRGRIQYDRKRLLIASEMVADPIHFRYGWGRNPLANLQAAGHKDLPLATQRSDNWRAEEVPLGILGDKVELPISRRDSNKLRNALRQQDKDRRIMEARRTLSESGEGE